jgi:polyhydroxybutyrate depolymerase
LVAAVLYGTSGCGAGGGPGGSHESVGTANVNSLGQGPCGASTLRAGTFQLTFDGNQYGYIVHLPPSYDGKTRTPLVLNWHGMTSNASEEQAFSGMNPVADSQGFILVYPSSPDGSWNAGTCCAAAGTNRDDVGFALALVHSIEQRACVDAKRVYSTGFSNGAFMSYRLGCEHAETFAAIAPVAGKVGIADCKPSRPVPLMAFHGTGDPLVSYDGGALSAEGLSVPDTVRAWALGDGCTQDPDVTYQMGSVTCDTYSAGDGGVTATLCTALGAGHCWPGQTYCPHGESTMDINASSQIGAFFGRFSLP